jgi:protein-disulfide isomerase
VGLGATLYLAYASFFIIRAVCLMCLVTYGAVAGLFLISGARTSFPMLSLPRRFVQDLKAALASPVGLSVLLVFVMAATSAVAFVPRRADGPGPGGAPAAQGQAAPADRQAEFLKFWESQPRVPVPVPADGAAVLVIKFSDYQCPACAQSHVDYKPILAKYQAQYPGAIRVVLKDYPLDRECNAGMPRDMHLAACEAAAATRMARARGRGEAMEDWLYANHAALTPPAVRQAARDVGGITDFDAQYAPVLDQIKADVALASILNIRVTPTFYVNGVRLEGGLPAQYFDMAIQYELKKAGKLTP